MEKNNKLLRVVSDIPLSINEINSDNNNMRDSIYRYFSKISEESYSKCHISINNEIIYNAVFKSNTFNEFLRKPQITIADIGAGYCALEKKLLNVLRPDQDISIIAVDSSVNMIKNSKIILKKYPFNIQFIMADAFSTGVKSDCSDITFVINVLPYIKDVRAVLTELYRITHSKGIIVIVQPVRDSFNFWDRCFDGIKIYFHENFEKVIDLERFQIVENVSINLTPIQDVDIIKVKIGKLIILKVLK